jgi:hypothetical protein
MTLANLQLSCYHTLRDSSQTIYFQPNIDIKIWCQYLVAISGSLTISEACGDGLSPNHFSMAPMNSSPTKRIELFCESIRLNCSCLTCDGWLRIFGNSAMTPNYVRCSNEVDGVPPPTCTVKVMFSKFQSICSVVSSSLLSSSSLLGILGCLCL